MLLSKNVTGGGQNLGKNWQLPENKLFRKLIFKVKTNLQLLIRKIEKIWIESETIPPSPTPLVKLKKKKAGTVVLEVVFTLPLVFYMVFFCVELIRINITNDALQTICEEATFLTSAHNYESGPDLIAKIDAIIEKHRPRFIPQKAPGYSNQPFSVIRWNIDTYTNANDIFSYAPYGGSTVTYQPYETDAPAKDRASPGYHAGVTQFHPILGQLVNYYPMNWRKTQQYMNDTSSGIPSNIIFVITFVCNYPFSNGLVKLLFNSGVNTAILHTINQYIGPIATGKGGTMYLLYTRGAGIVGKKK